MGEKLWKLAMKNETLVIDSWSNIHNDPVTTACILIGGKSYVEDSGNSIIFLKSVEV